MSEVMPMPMGKIRRIRVTWWDPPYPEPGDYMKSEYRARIGYFITEVIWGPKRPKALKVIRVGLKEIPTDARVFPWRWEKRMRKQYRRMSHVKD